MSATAHSIHLYSVHRAVIFEMAKQVFIHTAVARLAALAIGFLVEILTLKARKWLIFLTPPLFDAPARENPLEFRGETDIAKTTGMGLACGENFIILSSTVFV